MDMNTFLSFFLATDNPVLPHQLLLPLILRGGWALVLGCGAGYLARPLARP